MSDSQAQPEQQPDRPESAEPADTPEVPEVKVEPTEKTAQRIGGFSLKKAIVWVQSQLPKSTANQAQVKQELQTAWQFTKEQVIPPILSGVVFVVDKLDPPIANLAQKLSQTIQSQQSWQKLVSSPFWQKATTAIAPLVRSLNQAWTSTVTKLTLSDQLKHILSKRAALSTLFLIVLTISLLKPAPTPKAVAITKSVPPNVELAIKSATVAYGEGLVQTIQGNPQIGRLSLELTDSWYQLTAEQQDQMVIGIQRSAENLKFAEVLISDNAHHLIARPAIVGKGMIIVRR